MRKYRTLALFLILFSSSCLAMPKSIREEKDYNDYWCRARNGIREFETIDGSYVDCLLPDYAVEGERAYKWKEAVGQSLFYGIQTHRRPAILLIVEYPAQEQEYIKRVNKVANLYGITIWYISPSELSTFYK